MIDYTISCQTKPDPPETSEFYRPGFFFNEREHLCQQRDGLYYLVTAVNQQTKKVEARCAFFISSRQARSPGAAPFGSIEFTETLPDYVLDQMIVLLQAEARSAGASEFQLVNYPHCYAPTQASRLTEKLLVNGFQIARLDTSYFLPITNKPFLETIIPAERRRLRKCQNADFVAGQWSAPDYSEVVAFVQTVNQQRGYLPTISYEHLTILLQTFPSQFPVFIVHDDDQLIALAITVRVRDDILYNFLPVSLPAYNAFSPMVMLLDALFTYCQHQRVRLLDLGVSLDSNRQPKPGLIRFKQNLGALQSPKLVFEKRI